jgi:hypothetical protein
VVPARSIPPRGIAGFESAVRVLSRHLAAYFDEAVRSRGEYHFEAGAVDVDRGDHAAVLTTTSTGPRTSFSSGLFFVRGRLYVTCGCSRFAGGAPCEHLWASIREAEEQELLSRAIFFAEVVPLPAAVFAEKLRVEHGRFGTPQRAKPAAWRQQVALVRDSARGQSAAGQQHQWPGTRQVVYAIPIDKLAQDQAFSVEILYRDPRKDGNGFTKPKALRIGSSQIAAIPDPAERELLLLFAGATPANGQAYSGYYGAHYYSSPSDFGPVWRLEPALARELLPRIARAGRLFSRESAGKGDLAPLAWDEGGEWRFTLDLAQNDERLLLSGFLYRDGETMDLEKPRLLLASGFLLNHGSIGLLDRDVPFAWIRTLRMHKAIEAPAHDLEDFLPAVLEPGAAEIRVPDSLRVESVRIAPGASLRISREETFPLRVDLAFRYGDAEVGAGETRSSLYDSAAGRLLHRDLPAERTVLDTLNRCAQRCTSAADDDAHWHITDAALPALLSTAAAAGWDVSYDGTPFRAPGEGSLSISSGIDWFDLDGSVDYGGTVARLPALLEALQRDDKLVRLEDGSLGLLPAEWLERLKTLAGIGDLSKERLRFRRNQAGLLDALLAVQPGISFDEGFAEARRKLHAFSGIAPADQPAGFTGSLREYQREGLAWLRFLDDFGFGGCLADDMGVGKTVQVLAMLEARRTAPDRTDPFLVVVPRSLVFNWREEAARFTPEMRVLDHTGAARSTGLFAEHDIVLTTYGTLRRDAAILKDVSFDYIILDEAQAVKNASTETAKAVRLLKGRRRLAMSGTPVENHLGELWSLFEFLNPGMMGGAKVLRNAGTALRNPPAEMRALLGHALRPYILRRTKAQVASELPEKTEQTVFCELDKGQRKLYDEMRNFYRASLLSRVDKHGLAKSKMHVLEALLRLRQAACHPGLLDAKRIGEASAKLDSLLGHLESVLEEGHKALVFSQFTSLLAIVRERLDRTGVTYEYLDGQTRDRQARVDRFQNDPACPLFLVSLKAGGLGLNLTAAEYVFLLDPWWNPAVESQAIDRAHRIGQTRRVFAYRLIARDTVEEKVIELQKSKRDLADAIIGADNSLVRGLQREDLELLLS